MRDLNRPKDLHPQYAIPQYMYIDKTILTGIYAHIGHTYIYTLPIICIYFYASGWYF